MDARIKTMHARVLHLWTDEDVVSKHNLGFRLMSLIGKMIMMFICGIGSLSVIANEYIVNVDSIGGTSIIKLPVHTSGTGSDIWRCEFSYDAYSISWISDVQVYGYTGKSFSGDGWKDWQSLLQSNGHRLSNIIVSAYECYGVPLEISVICSPNTSGSERSYRARLTSNGDYLTIKQSARPDYEIITPIKDAYGQHTVTIGAAGGVIMVVIRNNTQQEVSANIISYALDAPQTSFVNFSGSSYFKPNSDNTFTFAVEQMPSGITAREAYINFRNTAVPMNLLVSRKATCERNSSL